MKSANGSSEINKSSEMDFSENILELTSTRDAVRQVKNLNGDIEVQGSGTLVRQLSEAPRREIEDLVGKLMTLHKKLQEDGDRLQLDIEEYTDLNQRVMQLTTIIADSVGRLPDPRVN
jgi:hypothetical protein